jgi:hypothetical protein
MNDPFELLGGLSSDPELRDHLTALLSHLNNWCGVLCFSQDWQNPLLWSHYGDKHKGICLGLDISVGVVPPVLSKTRWNIFLKYFVLRSNSSVAS